MTRNPCVDTVLANWTSISVSSNTGLLENHSSSAKQISLLAPPLSVPRGKLINTITALKVELNDKSMFRNCASKLVINIDELLYSAE